MIGSQGPQPLIQVGAPTMIDSLAAPAHPYGAPPASKTLTRFVEQCSHQ